jgi:hypothetical protein
MAKSNKKRIYECEHYQYEYDDWGKYAWCHSGDCLSRECIVDYTFCQDLCPFYEKNREGRYIYIDFDDRRKEIRERCKAELREKAEEALEEASKAIESANKKMLYAKKLGTI